MSKFDWYDDAPQKVTFTTPDNPQVTSPGTQRMYIVLRDDDGNRFILPPGYVEERRDGTSYAPSDAMTHQLAGIAAVLGLSFEEEPCHLIADADGHFNIHHVVVKMGVNEDHAKRDGVVAWLISGPAYEAKAPRPN